MSKEDFEALKEHGKQVHQERVSKNPARIAYAEEKLTQHGIRYEVKNPVTGHIHAWDDRGNLQQFWAGTGKIFNHSSIRGINNFIQVCLGESLWT